MSKLVEPKVYHVGYTQIDFEGLNEYLRETGQMEFLYDFTDARRQGISTGEILCSVAAKLCYKSLVEGKNLNLKKVRGIKGNLEGVFDSGHGSVFEHAGMNFIIVGSRVFTHELVRHRVGTAFSQTSGRYVRSSEIEFTWDPILEPVRMEIQETLRFLELQYARMQEALGFLDPLMGMEEKKKKTSALRRILPNGLSNEIMFTANFRTLRHTLMLRTSRYAEWEIRVIFNQIYQLVKAKYPLMLYGAIEKEVHGLLEITGLKQQPYERSG